MIGNVQELLKRHLESRGRYSGLADFIAATGKGQCTIERWLDGANNPDSANTYLLALTCGLNEEDAFALAGLNDPRKDRASA